MANELSIDCCPITLAFNFKFYSLLLILELACARSKRSCASAARLRPFNFHAITRLKRFATVRRVILGLHELSSGFSSLLFVQVILARLHSSSMIYLVMSAVGILSNNNSYQISVSILLGSHPIHKSLYLKPLSMKQFLPLPILFLILPEVKQFFFCNTRCPNDYPLLHKRLGVNQKLLFHGRNLILHKILIISAVYWSTLEGMLIFTSLLLIVIILLPLSL